MTPDDIFEHLAEAVWDYSERSAGPKDWSEASPAERSDLLMDVRRVVIRLAQIAREEGVKGTNGDIGPGAAMAMHDAIRTWTPSAEHGELDKAVLKLQRAFRAGHVYAKCWLQGLVEGLRGEDSAYELGRQDGYEEAVQAIDVDTGGDGEFVCVLGPDPDERDCRTPGDMARRVADRFAALKARVAELGAENARLQEAIDDALIEVDIERAGLDGLRRILDAISDKNGFDQAGRMRFRMIETRNKLRAALTQGERGD